jgi:hypothetical protein
MAFSEAATSPIQASTGHRVLASAFILAIALPLAANLAGIDGGDPHSENRELAPFPPLPVNVEALAVFPAGLDAWFQDHYGFRSQLVRWFGRLRYGVLEMTPTTSVVRGKNGWLFYADDDALRDYVAETLLPVGEVANWKEALVRARDWAQARGIGYVFTIAPDKHIIYPEQMPHTIRPLGRTHRMDQVFAALGDTRIAVDTREALHDAKARERLYHLTDTHWNARGAFVAYQAIIDAVRQQAPEVPPAWQRSDFSESSHQIDGLDLARMMGLNRVLREQDLGLVPRRRRRARVVEPPGAAPTAEVGLLVTEIPASRLPRAVIFRDSFASALVPFLSEHFSRAVYLWQNDFDVDAVLRERPDVVIQQIVGRHLYSFIPSPDLVPRSN